MKIKSFTTLCLLLAFSINANAFGLGKIQVKSSLNDPFEATIELTGTLDFNESQLVVRLGNEADFERMGIVRESVLLLLTFEPQLKAAPPVIVVRSSQPIREPVLDFVVDVQSPNAQAMKEYTVFLNPAK